MEPTSHRTRIRIALGLAVLGGLASLLSVFATPVEGASGFGCFVKFFNCDRALDSRYAKFFGIPLGVYGLFYFAFWGLMLNAFRRTGWDGYRFGVTAATFAGALLSIGLLLLLLAILRGSCLYCLATHAANLGAFAMLWPLRSWRFPKPIPPDHCRRGIILTLVALVLAGGLFGAGEIRAAKARARAEKETIW